MQIGSWRWVGNGFKVLDRLTRFFSVMVGALQKTDPQSIHPLLSPYLVAVQRSWVAPALLIALPVVVWLRHKTDRSKLDAVHGLLDQIREDAFLHDSFEHEQHGRVTLFKHRYFAWRFPFFGGWLIPIERSGHATRKTHAIFRAPDDGESAEGVAGRAWSRWHKVYVPNLPQLRRAGVTDIDFETYGAKAFCSVARLRKKPPQARALLGIPVESANKRWGVVVIDSVHESIREKAANQVFKKLAPTLSSYLRGL